MSSLCQVRADTNLAIEKFYFSIFLTSDLKRAYPIVTFSTGYPDMFSLIFSVFLTKNLLKGMLSEGLRFFYQACNLRDFGLSQLSQGSKACCIVYCHLCQHLSVHIYASLF